MQSPTRTSMLTFLCSFMSMMFLLSPLGKLIIWNGFAYYNLPQIKRFSFELEGEWTAFLICPLFIASSSGLDSKGISNAIEHDRLCLVTSIIGCFVY